MSRQSTWTIAAWVTDPGDFPARHHDTQQVQAPTITAAITLADTTHWRYHLNVTIVAATRTQPPSTQP